MGLGARDNMPHHPPCTNVGPVDLSLENDSASPCGGGSSQSVYLQQFRQDVRAGADLPLMCWLPGFRQAGWGGFEIALLKLNSPAGTQGTPRELAIVPACGVAVLVPEGRELRSPAGSSAD